MGRTVKEHSVGGGSGKGKHYSDQYVILKTIGKGGQGRTEIAKRRRDGKVFVRKVQKDFRWLGDRPKESVLFEEVLTPHPSIVEFDHANFLDNDQSLVLYFEHCEGGDLQHFIDQEDRPSEKFIWSVFLQLADALAFLHYGISRRHPHSQPEGWRRVIHRDLKPANVFLRKKLSSRHPDPDVVLGDFGLATLNEVTHGCGTDLWWAPEIPECTKEGDVWGLGAIIHFMAHGVGPVGRPPSNWPRDKASVDQWYRRPKSRQPKQLSTAYSDKLNRNMMDCLMIDPKKRISSKNLLRNLENERPRH